MSKHCFRLLQPPVYVLPLMLIIGLLGSAANDRTATAHPAQSVGAWVPLSSLNVGRSAHSATLLNDGRILVAGGLDSANRELKSAEIYDPSTGRSMTVGDLNEARSNHHAVGLKDGRVLVINKQSAETFNPVTGQWTLTGPTTLQAGATSGNYDRGSVALLANGKVLLTGGQAGILTFARNGAELFDPATGNWTATGGMNFGRSDHSMTLLPNGKVLAAGGINRMEQPVVTELYDPETGQWTRTGSLRVPRYRHCAAYLPNGRVLVAGGTAETSLSSFTLTSRTAELYDPVTGTWGFAEASNYSHSSPQGQVVQLSDGRVLFANSGELYDFNTGRWTFVGRPLSAGQSRIIALPNGKALLTGGSNSRALRLVQLFDPALSPVQIPGQWSLASPYGAGLEHAATALPDGKVLVTGGAVPSAVTGTFLAQASARVFDAKTGWQTVNNLAFARHRHSSTLMPNGQVLVTGGESITNTALSSVELFNPTTNVWNNAASLSVPRRWHQAVLLANGKVLVAGGSNDSSMLSDAELYDPAMDRWTNTGAMNVARRFHTLTALANGNVLAVGGENNGAATASAELYDPATGNWRTVAALKTARHRHTATRLPDGRVLVVGGDNNDSLFSAEIFDPATEQWTVTSSLLFARRNHSATLLDNGRVLIAGGADKEGQLSSVELFDPMAEGGTGVFNNTGWLSRRRELHSAIKLPDSKVLAISGVTSTTQGTTVTQQVVPEAELFDPTLTTPISIPRRFAAVSASSYRGGDLASGSIIAIFGEGFSNSTAVATTTPLPTTLAGARVIITRTDLSPPLPLFFVSPNQINAQLLNSLNNTAPLGMITLTITTSEGQMIQEPVYVAPVAPGVFSADSSGRGLAAAVALRIKANGQQVYEPVARFDPAQNRVVAVPLDLSNPNELVFLILYGSGWRSRSSLSAVTATVGGLAVEVSYAGQQTDFVGLDQANLRLPNALVGRGEVEVRLTVDGIAANAVTVVIK